MKSIVGKCSSIRFIDALLLLLTKSTALRALIKILFITKVLEQNICFVIVFKITQKQVKISKIKEQMIIGTLVFDLPKIMGQKATYRVN